MANFVQTMKDWRRMCIAANDGPDTTKCGNCPMGETRMCAFEISDIGDYELQEAETIITKWAAEHPEPVYPTWGEWLESEGICFSRLTNYERIGGLSIPQVFEYQIDGKTAFICGDKANSPIPADIAQKLGIEPKEG